jgi:hypothetical protein
MMGTNLFTNPLRPRNNLGLHASTSFTGHGPASAPEVNIEFTVTGPPARALVQADTAAPMALVFLDSTVIALPVLQRNPAGSARLRTSVNFSVALDTDTWRKILRDRFLALRVGPEQLVLHEEGHRWLRVLYRVAVCQTVE